MISAVLKIEKSKML